MVDTEQPNHHAALADLTWLVGSWSGQFGERQVEEVWTAPKHGIMGGLVRLYDAKGLNTIELILIRAQGESLTLSLRQFEPDLTPRYADELSFHSITSTKSQPSLPEVSFRGHPDKKITGLTYRLLADKRLRIEVALTGGITAPAELTRV